MEFDLSIAKPNYRGGSIVNLMTSIKQSFGSTDNDYPALELLPSEVLKRNEKTILLIIDGLGADLLEEFSAHSNASDRLADRLRGRITSVYPPTTASAVTTFMSGQAPQQHALTGWFMNFREIGMTTAVLPFVARGGHGSLTEQGVEIGELVDCKSVSKELSVDSSMLLPAEIADSAYSSRVGEGLLKYLIAG
jgi:Type I phosphodiesterase / nucleotide pyrophosphatase